MGDARNSPDGYGVFTFVDPDHSAPPLERAPFVASPAKRTVKERMKLEDFRESNKVEKGAMGLDVQGFTYVNHKFSLDENEILEGTNAEEVYAEEVKELMAKLTGASRVVVHSVMFRRGTACQLTKQSVAPRCASETDGQARKLPKDGVFVMGRQGPVLDPVREVHRDLTLDCAHDMIRYFRKIVRDAAKPTVELEDARARGEAVKVPRYAGYAIWRPLKTVKRDPIAVVDYRSVDESETAITISRIPSKVNEDRTFVLSGSVHTPPKKPEALKWYWMLEQKPDEVCVIKAFDTACVEDRNIAAGGFHCSPVIPGTEDMEPRQSVEARAYCFWE